MLDSYFETSPTNYCFPDQVDGGLLGIFGTLNLSSVGAVAATGVERAFAQVIETTCRVR